MTSVAPEYHPWTTFADAREWARRVGDARIGTEHLLLALLCDDEVTEVLGVSLEDGTHTLAELDARALRAIGVEVDESFPLLHRRPTRSRPSLTEVLAKRLPMSPAAKAALRVVGRPLRHRDPVSPLAALRVLLDLEPPDPCAALLSGMGVDLDAARARVDRALAG